MAKELLVNVSKGEEVRVALVEDGRLEELYMERDSAASNVGNIYLGKVTNVESSIQAAFIDFGYGRNGFLHVQDLHPQYFPDNSKWDNVVERVGKKIGRRDRPPIQQCLRRGDEVVVQIIKEGIGTKGPTLTSYPSVAGRYLVMMPGVRQMGVSKKIEDEDERRRLRRVLDTLHPPKDVGFIIRTAGVGKSADELENDFDYLARLYEQLQEKQRRGRPPMLLYSEGDLVTRTVRDVWTDDIERIVVDDRETGMRIKEFFDLMMPDQAHRVEVYTGDVPLFFKAGVEHEIETMFSRTVPLPSGGSLVIDSTEAIVAIDVNSGKFREHSDAEETAFRTDMEAADEICRQLRLRDLGGVVIVDFIDLRYARHRQQLFDRLTELFKRDRAKSRHLEMNEFGIVSITRQRMRPDLKKSVYMPCPLSGGTGFIKTPESMALDVMRRLRVACHDDRVSRVSVRLYPAVAMFVLNAKRMALAELERETDRPIEIQPDASLPNDVIKLELFDDRDQPVQIEALLPREEVEIDSGGRRRRGSAGTGRGRSGGRSKRPALDGLDEGDTIVLGDTLEIEEEPESVRKYRKFEEDAEPADEVLPRGRRDEPAREAEEYEAEEETTARRRRRGGRRRRRNKFEGDETQAAESAKPSRSDDDDDEFAAEVEEAVEEREIEAYEEATEAASEARGEESEMYPDDKRGRRRRRRGRGRGRDQEQDRQPQAEGGRAHAHVPDDDLDRRVNGNRVDAETHTLRRSPFAPLSGPRGDRRQDKPGFGKRGKGRGRSGRPEREERPSGDRKPYVEQLYRSNLPDEELDARINGNRAEATRKPAFVDEDESIGQRRPASESREREERGEAEGEGRGRRRRRRRRRGRQDESAVEAETMTPEPFDEPEEAIEELVEEPAIEELEPVETEAVEPEPVTEAPQAEDVEEEGARRRRRRRPKGKFVRSRPLVVEEALRETEAARERSPAAEALPEPEELGPTPVGAVTESAETDDTGEEVGHRRGRRRRSRPITTPKAAEAAESGQEGGAVGPDETVESGIEPEAEPATAKRSKKTAKTAKKTTRAKTAKKATKKVAKKTAKKTTRKSAKKADEGASDEA